MRLGGPVFGGDAVTRDPDAWIAALRARNYRAAYCPLDERADDATVRAFANAARAADIVIAEVGAWSNPLSPDDATREKALALCRERLALADRIGARCCVNIAGSRGPKWDGPHPDDLTEDTFALLVETVRAIIDAVKPRGPATPSKRCRGCSQTRPTATSACSMPSTGPVCSPSTLTP